MNKFDSPVQKTTDDPLGAFYQRTHPEYESQVEHWRFCRATYSGGPAWFFDNIFRYHKEGDVEFADRLARAYRPNHTREVVELIQKYIFKSPVKRDESAPEELKRFWKAASSTRQTIDELMAEVSSSTSIATRVALVIDSTNIGGEDVSQAEAEQVESRVYGYIVQPENILDYSLNKKDGELNWIKLREFVRDDEDPFGEGLVREQVRLWDRQGWKLLRRPLDDAGKAQPVQVVGSGSHGLGCVPVLLIDHASTQNPYRATGLIDDIVYLDRAYANYLSNLDAIIQDQTYSQLAIPAESLPQDQGGAQQHMREMGTKRIFTYHAGIGSSARPEFISPDPKQAGVILSVCNKIISEIYTSIGMGGERTKQDNAVGIDNSSGVAKAYDFERINSLLLMKAKRLERAENWAAGMVMKWAGSESKTEVDLVTYPDSFDVATLGDELATAEALLKVQAPIEVRREQMKEIVLKLMPHVTDEVWKKLMTAIEKWSDPEPVAPAGSGAKPGATTPSRQGSVTSTTKTIPKNEAK